MALDLTPKDYLKMLKEEYGEFAKDPLSMRKALTCCFFSNALPEVVFKTYETRDKGKVHNAACTSDYRKTPKGEGERSPRDRAGHL